MIVIPICLKCVYLEKGMRCPTYPEGLPDEILLAQKAPKETCEDYKENNKYMPSVR